MVSAVKCYGDPITLNAEIVAGHSIVWNGPSSYYSENYSNTFDLSQEYVGQYAATLSSLGCVSPVSYVMATVDYDQFLEDYNFPNVISPNGDGVNDEIDISTYAQSCEPFEWFIINRWGNLIYQGNENAMLFKGLDMKGEPLNEGIYFYKLLYEIGEKNGFIHIVK